MLALRREHVYNRLGAADAGSKLQGNGRERQPGAQALGSRQVGVNRNRAGTSSRESRAQRSSRRCPPSIPGRGGLHAKRAPSPGPAFGAAHRHNRSTALAVGVPSLISSRSPAPLLQRHLNNRLASRRPQPSPAWRPPAAPDSVVPRDSTPDQRNPFKSSWPLLTAQGCGKASDWGGLVFMHHMGSRPRPCVTKHYPPPAPRAFLSRTSTSFRSIRQTCLHRSTLDNVQKLQLSRRPVRASMPPKSRASTWPYSAAESCSTCASQDSLGQA